MSESSITLHPTQGVNPHLTYCRRCGADTNELLLIGNRTAIRRCTGCGVTLLGHRANDKCNQCGSYGPHTQTGTIAEGEKLPGNEFCDKCKAEVAEHRAIVEAGGIFFKCTQCGKEGVIKHRAPICAEVRKRLNVPAPKPCGIEFHKCSQHGA